jgi:hypothetical protein
MALRRTLRGRRRRAADGARTAPARGSVVALASVAAALTWCLFGGLPSGMAGPATAAAATYYVSPSGDDGAPGSRARPWRSPGLASKRLHSGDTLVILRGRYVLRTFWDDMITPPSGTAAAPTRIVGEAGQRPVLAGSNDLFSAVDVSGTSYVTLENFEITADGGARFRGGIEAAGDPVDHLVLRDLSIHHIDEMALNIGDVRHLLVERCRFSHCGFGCIGGPEGRHGGNRNVTVRDCYLGYSGHYYRGGPGPGPYDRPDGFGIEPSAGPILIDDTVAEHNRGDGLDSKAAATTIRRCTVANNSCDGVKLWAGGRVENTLIYGMGDGVGGASPWAGIVMGGEPGATFTIVNVTVHDDPTRHAYPVYMQYGEPEPMTVLIRNTVIANGHGEVYLGDAVTARIDHCGFYRPGADVQVHANGRDYTAAQLRAGALGAGNLSAPPRFTRPAWGTRGDFRPRAGSPLIDAGTASGAPAVDLAGDRRPAGGAVDIGAFEYGAEPAPQPGPDAVRAPRLRSLSARRVRPGRWVTLRGSGFGRSRAAAAAPYAKRRASVLFGSRRARVYASWRDGRIRVKVPPRPAGRVRVRVRTAAGRSDAIWLRIVPPLRRR